MLFKSYRCLDILSDRILVASGFLNSSRKRKIFSKNVLWGSTASIINGSSGYSSEGYSDDNMDRIGAFEKGVFNDRTLTSILTSSAIYWLGSYKGLYLTCKVCGSVSGRLSGMGSASIRMKSFGTPSLRNCASRSSFSLVLVKTQPS